MHPKWTQGFTKQEKDEFLQALRNDTFVLNRLKDLLDEFLDSCNRQEETEDWAPGWAERTAFRFGTKRGIRKVRQLLEFLDG